MAQGAETDNDRGVPPSVIWRKTRSGGRVGRGTRSTAAAPARGLRMVLLRTTDAMMDLALTLEDPLDATVSLGELLERIEDRTLLLLIEGPQDALGLCLLSSGLLAGLTEWQTMRRISPAPPQPRIPTRTDASIVAGWLDRVLTEFAAGHAGIPLVWATGFRFSSYLPDARPVEHLLEDTTYRLFTAEISMAGGKKSGVLWLAFPNVSLARAQAQTVGGGATETAWSEKVERAVLAAPVRLDAVLARINLPLSTLMDLRAGSMLPLSMKMIDRVGLEGPNRQIVACGSLGQSQGHRALRLNMPEEDAVAPTFGAALPAPLAKPALPTAMTQTLPDVS